MFPIQQQPKNVYKFILLARKYASSDYDGIHTAILTLMTKKNELESNQSLVVWKSEHYIYIDEDKVITLHQWLEDNGFDPIKIYKDKKLYKQFIESRNNLSKKEH